MYEYFVTTDYNSLFAFIFLLFCLCWLQLIETDNLFEALFVTLMEHKNYISSVEKCNQLNDTGKTTTTI